MRSSNTCRNRLLSCLVAGLVASCFVETVRALDPDKAMSQYMRDQWGTESGFPGGPVYAITQTSDGYLWIGTEKGLVRFDGVSFDLVHHSSRTLYSVAPVLGLAADTDGSLWALLYGPTLLRYPAAGLQRATPDLALPDSLITAMWRTAKGRLLFSALGRGVLTYRAGRFETLGPSTHVPRSIVISLAETPDGDVWMGTRDAGLFRSTGQQVVSMTKGLPDAKINGLVPGDGRDLWIATDKGVVRWDGAAITASGVPPALDRVRAITMTRDRDSNVWVGAASSGLVRVNLRRGPSAEASDPRPGGAEVSALFEDREGNLWIGTTRGLERLREGAFTTYSVQEGMPSETSGPVYVDAERRAWFAPSEGGLYWLREGRVGRVTDDGLDGDVVYSIAGAARDLWIGRQRGGLTHLREDEGSFTTRTYARAQGLAQDSVYAVHRSRDGAVWAGTLSGGVSRYKDGAFTTYTTAHGLASNTVASIVEASDGTMWFATPSGLTALANGTWRSYAVGDGLPSQNVSCLLEDSGGVLWVGTSQGLAFLDSTRRADRVQVPQGASGALQETILGVAEDKSGSLWISTSSHVVRVKRDVLLSGALTVGDVREFGIADGLRGLEGVRRHRSVVTDTAGRIWFSMNRGLSVVDPARTPGSAAPAMIRVRALTADGAPIDVRGPVRIPAGRRRIAFSFVGLSLSVPERVRYRYRLDGFDRDWSAPVATRDAIYTNLDPGSYRFRVMASNSDGLWNGSEALVGFDIEPAFWQTWWFLLSALVACGAAGVGLYRVRVRQVSRRLGVLFEERLAERMRIAQDLHDTLLQGFISASMQLHVAADQLPVDSPAKPRLGRVLELMGRVIEEGRNAVRDLRSSSARSDELGEALSRVPQELGIELQAGFRVIVEGRPQPLHPLIRDEAYRIGREALVNAFRHSGARNIEVELEYAAHHLTVLVRDDGGGIDPQVLRSGREGHWGLPGMRERAERIGARFKVRSRASAGTEVELSIPGSVAFERGGERRRRRERRTEGTEGTETEGTEATGFQHGETEHLRNGKTKDLRSKHH